MRRTLWAAVILYWCAAFVMTHIPSQHVPAVPVTDKVEHFLGYALLGGGLYWCMRWSGIRDTGVKVLMILLIYGMIDEWLQALPFVHRSCEFLDWCADVAGTGTAVTIGTIVGWWLKPDRPATGERS